jgi:hypothetical protein
METAVQCVIYYTMLGGCPYNISCVVIYKL